MDSLERRIMINDSIGGLAIPSDGVMHAGGPLLPRYVVVRFQRSFETGTGSWTGTGVSKGGERGTLKGNVGVGCESGLHATASADANARQAMNLAVTDHHAN